MTSLTSNLNLQFGEVENASIIPFVNDLDVSLADIIQEFCEESGIDINTISHSDFENAVTTLSNFIASANAEDTGYTVSIWLD